MRDGEEEEGWLLGKFGGELGGGGDEGVGAKLHELVDGGAI